MFKAIDIWKRIDDTAAIRYRCFERLTDGQFCVQSVDYYHLPLNEKQIKTLDNQFLELFIEESPDQRSSLHPTLEEAIAQYDQDFTDDVASSPLEPQVA
ncbi:MAG: hypothetical protein DSM106950_03170 [Stigonema ocellatum SAG 48.90 = DSM 106950]|nr:hypothetical protein [Stigonema ocellatum SAG 48.90 = DSM 106950]